MNVFGSDAVIDQIVLRAISEDNYYSGIESELLAIDSLLLNNYEFILSSDFPISTNDVCVSLEANELESVLQSSNSVEYTSYGNSIKMFDD